MIFDRKNLPLLFVLLVVFFAIYMFITLSADKLSPEDKRIESVVENYIKSHPDVILSSLQEMQTKQMHEEQEKAKESLSKNKDALFDTATTPYVASSDFDVTVVEFFDYNCGYCKRATQVVDQLIKEDKKVRVIFREFPILAETSVMAAKAALAVNKLNRSKYFEFHDALMKEKSLDENSIVAVAKKLGFEESFIKAAIKSNEYDGELSQNRDFAKALGIQGTPAFVIGDEMIPGAVGLDKLKEVIAAARKNKKT